MKIKSSVDTEILMYNSGFKAGQKQEQERMIKLIEELVLKHWNKHSVFNDRFLQELKGELGTK